MEIYIVSILATVGLALVGGRFLLKEIVGIVETWTTLREKLPHKPPKIEGSYSEKLQSLTKSLTTASQEMDVLLDELTEVSKDRQQAIEKVESDLAKLQIRELELQERIEHLQKVPLPVAEYFAQLTGPRWLCTNSASKLRLIVQAQDFSCNCHLDCESAVICDGLL